VLISRPRSTAMLSICYLRKLGCGAFVAGSCGWCNVARYCGAFDVTARRKPNLSALNTRAFNVNLEWGCGGESALLSLMNLIKVHCTSLPVSSAFRFYLPRVCVCSGLSSYCTHPASCFSRSEMCRQLSRPLTLSRRFYLIGPDAFR
jgi:hypothetical protein